MGGDRRGSEGVRKTKKFGVVEYWSNGVVGAEEQKSWLSATKGLQDAVEFYKLSCLVYRRFPYELKRVASQAIASSDSVHRNIAEGYCRRSIREYLNFLNVALGSLGESVSGLHAYREAGQITEDDFRVLDELAFKVENGLL